MNHKAKQILQKADVDKLPSLPHVLLHLLDICHGESLSFSDLASTLRQDPGLFARIYSVCDYDHCQNDDSPESVEQALQQLGINTIKNLALSTAVLANMKKKAQFKALNMDSFWRHSIGAGVAAKLIAGVKALAAATTPSFLKKSLLCILLFSLLFYKNLSLSAS